MLKYAVLWDTRGVKSLPVGVALDLGDHVCIDVDPAYGLPARVDTPYQVLQRDGQDVTYRPGDPSYLDQVLVDLSSMFAIGERIETI